MESYQSIAGNIELVKGNSTKSIQEGIDSLNKTSFSNDKNILPKIESQALVNKIKLLIPAYKMTIEKLSENSIVTLLPKYVFSYAGINN